VSLVLPRGTDRHLINAEVDPADASRADPRGLLPATPEPRADRPGRYAAVTLPDWLNARARELWRPLLAVAACAEALALVPDLLALARQHVADRGDISAEGSAVLASLVTRLGPAPRVMVRPGELAEDLRQRLGWSRAARPEHVWAWLRRVGFRRGGKDREGARYEIGAERLREITARYTPERRPSHRPPHRPTIWFAGDVTV
jgi:hypothetical protein